MTRGASPNGSYRWEVVISATGDGPWTRSAATNHFFDRIEIPLFHSRPAQWLSSEANAETLVTIDADHFAQIRRAIGGYSSSSKLRDVKNPSATKTSALHAPRSR